MMKNTCNCDQPNEAGWHVADEVITDYRTLKQAQNEASEEVASWIAHVYFTKQPKVFDDLMLSIADGEFKGSYSRLCEWQTMSVES
jgi:hypothetical protein